MSQNQMNQNPAWYPKILDLVGLLLAIYLVVIGIQGIKDWSKPTMAQNTISVSATGEAYAIPDIATFTVGYSKTSKTVAEAQTAVTTKMNSVITALKGMNIADKDIKTTDYSIYPNYEYVATACASSYCPGKQVLSGYIVSQTVSVKIRDVAKAGDVIGAMGSLGVTNVSGLTFAVDDEDVVKLAARTDAVNKAKAKAEELAKSLGVSLVRITGFYENSNSPAYEMYSAKGMSAMSSVAPAVAPDLPAGQNKVTSSVSVTYEIK